MANFLHPGKRGDIIYCLPTIKKLGGGRLYLSSCLDLAPLLCELDYIKACLPWEGEKIDYDFNPFADDTKIETKHLVQTHWNVFYPNSTLDISEPWMDVEPKEIAELIITKSTRWPGNADWNVLERYKKRAVYVGWEWEYRHFRHFNVAYHYVRNALEFAQVIRGAKLFAGNQSFGFSLAEAMKVPRILDESYEWPNCTPHSSNGRIGFDVEFIEKYMK